MHSPRPTSRKRKPGDKCHGSQAATRRGGALPTEAMSYWLQHAREQTSFPERRSREPEAQAGRRGLSCAAPTRPRLLRKAGASYASLFIGLKSRRPQFLERGGRALSRTSPHSATCSSRTGGSWPTSSGSASSSHFCTRNSGNGSRRVSCQSGTSRWIGGSPLRSESRTPGATPSPAQRAVLPGRGSADARGGGDTRLDCEAD
jgi:hypothetical protein